MEHNLTTTLREAVGTGPSRAVRREALIPAILYGDKQDNVSVSILEKEIIKELKTPGFLSRVFNLNLNGKKHSAIARDIQFHPVTDRPMHIDFLRVNKSSIVNVTVPVEFINEDKAPGLKKGGVLNIVLHDLEMSCSADSIPEKIIMDLAGMEIHSSIYSVDVKFPKGTQLAHPDRDVTIATIVPPTVAKAEDTEVTEETAATPAA